MRNKFIVLTLLICTLLTGCGNNKTELTEKETPSPTIDLRGNKNVPKTENELVGGTYKEYTSLDEAIKEYGDTFEIPDLTDTYKNITYITEETYICALLKNDNDYISIKKSKENLEKNIETAYQFTSDKKIGTNEVKIYSRIDENSVGLVFWNEGVNYYSVEFTPYVETNLETATSIIKNIK